MKTTRMVAAQPGDAISRKRSRPLADFLRACRERLKPAELGLPDGQRRRTPGLRREEVATLCGISPTWYTWLEQGRTSAVSVQTLGALADGMRLSNAERAYLFELAERADPAARRAGTDKAQQAALQPLVDAMRAPAYALDRHWDAVAWNRPAAALFQGWLGPRPAVGRNLLRYVFLEPRAKELIVDWPERARRLVAEFRADTAAWQDDPAGAALAEELAQASPDFEAAWSAQRVHAREGGQRNFRHPKLGVCRYQQHTLRVAQQPAFKLIVLLPAG